MRWYVIHQHPFVRKMAYKYLPYPLPPDSLSLSLSFLRHQQLFTKKNKRAGGLHIPSLQAATSLTLKLFSSKSMRTPCRTCTKRRAYWQADAIRASPNSSISLATQSGQPQNSSVSLATQSGKTQLLHITSSIPFSSTGETRQRFIWTLSLYHITWDAQLPN